ncbi:MAG: septum formation inhibitor Maf [Idiomarina sp.]|nr:septum formation inhibitor Maf [Idiomarina sp.]
MSLPIVLASSSPYRRALLERLNLSFIAVAPEIDESPHPNETPDALVKRLATNKAKALSDSYPGHLIIGSDQVAVFQQQILGKPGSSEAAIQQLTQFSGHAVSFLTGLSVLNTQTGEQRTIVEPFQVYFRSLTENEIITYIKEEQPLDCAGSFKSEGLGITLFERMEGNDPNALIGLPLIQLLSMLRSFGVNPLQP